MLPLPHGEARAYEPGMPSLAMLGEEAPPSQRREPESTWALELEQP